MYLNWYHNFWNIVDAVGVRVSFLPPPVTGYLRPMSKGQPARSMETADVGTTLQNMFSGLRCRPDMYIYYIYGYSLLDLVAMPARQHERLQDTSVLAFMNSRGYMTDEAMSVQQDTLAKAVAAPSFLTASSNFR
jgi:hypothetical protein